MSLLWGFIPEELLVHYYFEWILDRIMAFGLSIAQYEQKTGKVLSICVGKVELYLKCQEVLRSLDETLVA